MKYMCIYNCPQKKRKVSYLDIYTLIGDNKYINGKDAVDNILKFRDFVCGVFFFCEVENGKTDRIYGLRAYGEWQL